MFAWSALKITKNITLANVMKTGGDITAYFFALEYPYVCICFSISEFCVIFAKSTKSYYLSIKLKKYEAFYA